MFIRRWPLNLAARVRCWGIPLNIYFYESSGADPSGRAV
jgi:hypothetical protein